MAGFLPYSILLLVLALLFVIVPLWRFRPVDRASDAEIRKQKNIQVFEQSLAELERDLADGIVAADEFEKLKHELERGFLRDMKEEEKQATASAQGKLLPILGLLFIPVFSYLLYDSVGSARDLALESIMSNLRAAETEEDQLARLDELAAFLQDRFNRHDDDIQNGYMLGTLYLELENYPSAVTTFRILADQMEASPDKATVLGQLAQAMYMAADSQLTDPVRRVMDEALAMNPNEYAVMSILAMDAVQREDFNGVLGYWRRQLMQMDASGQQAAVLRSRISQLEVLLGETGPQDTASDGPQASITLAIDIDDSVRDLVDESMTLYIFARRAGGGPPVAARSLSVQDFPFEITLDDSMAMMAGNNLSSAENIFVGARLSRSGQATAQPGDIQAVSEPFLRTEQEGPVSLVIKEIVQ
jgi:cytochrome c-type biogenesis protein CcmH